VLCKKKHKIILIGDCPGWAFHQIMLFVKKNFKSRLDIYYDFVIYHPKMEDPNIEKNNSSFIEKSYAKSLMFSKIPILKGIEYRLIKYLNKLNLLSFNENGKFQRLNDENTYDLIIFLDFYFQQDGDFSHVKAKKIIKGSYTDRFPPRNMFIDSESKKIFKLDNEKHFVDLFLKDSSAFIVGSEPIKRIYEKYFHPIYFLNLAYNEKVFKPVNTKRDSNIFYIGWTGNPNRDFKGYHTHIIPAVKELKRRGLNVELISKFEGPLKELPHFWKKVDLAVIASNADAGPSMFIEASLCGVPTVSTKIGLPSMIIQDNVNGLFCDRSIDDIANKIEKLVHDQVLLNTMKKRIRNDFIKMAGVEVMKSRWLNFFKNELLHE